MLCSSGLAIEYTTFYKLPGSKVKHLLEIAKIVKEDNYTRTANALAASMFGTKTSV